MDNTFLWIALGVAVVNWISSEKNWAVSRTITKPLVMIFLLGWLWQNESMSKEMIWFSLGLVFSLAGDIFLLVPRDKLFIPGLIAFLMAQLAYIVGFNLILPQLNLWVIFLSACLVAVDFAVYRRLDHGLIGLKAESLRLPVAIYASVITFMGLSSFFNLVRPGWSWQHALITVAGALSFIASDSLLAWNKFVKPTPHGDLTVITTYHLGQIGIVLGTILHLR